MPDTSSIPNQSETRACLRHCEERSDAAIQLSVPASLDCFALLAMTGEVRA